VGAWTGRRGRRTGSGRLPVPDMPHPCSLKAVLLFSRQPVRRLERLGPLSYPLTRPARSASLRALRGCRGRWVCQSASFHLPPVPRAGFSRSRSWPLHTVPLIALPAIWIAQGRLPFFVDTKPGHDFRSGPRRQAGPRSSRSSARRPRTTPFSAASFLSWRGSIGLCPSGSWRPIAPGSRRRWWSRPSASRVRCRSSCTSTGTGKTRRSHSVGQRGRVYA